MSPIKCCLSEPHSVGNALLRIPIKYIDLKNQWEKALGMSLKKSFPVCSTHFRHSDIISTWESGEGLNKYTTEDMGELIRLADVSSVCLNSTDSSGLRRFLQSQHLNNMINNISPDMFDYSEVTPPEAFISQNFQTPLYDIDYSEVTPPGTFQTNENQMNWTDDGYDFMFMKINTENIWYDDGWNEFLGNIPL